MRVRRRRRVRVRVAHGGVEGVEPPDTTHFLQLVPKAKAESAKAAGIDVKEVRTRAEPPQMRSLRWDLGDPSSAGKTRSVLQLRCVPSTKRNEVGDLHSQLLLFLDGVCGSQRPEARAASHRKSARGLILAQLAESAVGRDMRPVRRRHHVDDARAAESVRKPQACRRRQMATELAGDIRLLLTGELAKCTVSEGT